MRHDHRLERRWTHDITGLRRDFPTLLAAAEGISGEAWTACVVTLCIGALFLLRQRDRRTGS